MVKSLQAVYPDTCILYPDTCILQYPDTWVQPLGWEDYLEKEMITHSSILPWRIPWTEEPGGITVHGVAKSWT